MESNGTVAAPDGIDWLCISPKAGADWIQRSGQELKLVWPQPTFDLEAIEASTRFQHYFLQPMDNAQQSSNIGACIEQCMQRPGWRLSLQTHKLTGIR
ncbi:7-carboxy-7-deazaguanine synthase [bioreactor metagenome]|uniref:7-carboxy-7-deazaguanine synthase n=1 Tax=bioreactor metagenome TaxID=1076179 RepID=A0A645GZS6_9ZZZZ